MFAVSNNFHGTGPRTGVAFGHHHVTGRSTGLADDDATNAERKRRDAVRCQPGPTTSALPGTGPVTTVTPVWRDAVTSPTHGEVPGDAVRCQPGLTTSTLPGTGPVTTVTPVWRDAVTSPTHGEVPDHSIEAAVREEFMVMEMGIKDMLQTSLQDLQMSLRASVGRTLDEIKEKEKKPKTSKKRVQKSKKKSGRTRSTSDDTSGDETNEWDFLEGADRRKQRKRRSVKLPSFNGKDWDVWIKRFKAIAKLRGWTEEDCNDELIQCLEGPAADFVFDELLPDAIDDFRTLVRALEDRFQRIKPSCKVYGTRFAKRMQKVDESPEEFAADLKRLYARAYPSRDSRTRRVDLVGRFLDGLRDKQMQLDIEMSKDPRSIDDAVSLAMEYQEIKERIYGAAQGCRAVNEVSYETDVGDETGDEDDPEGMMKSCLRDDAGVMEMAAPEFQNWEIPELEQGQPLAQVNHSQAYMNHLNWM